jgi:predicted nucleic acid-binding protein
VDRLFLDANVLFSAAYREGAGLLILWELSKVRLVSSHYAIVEARRNLNTDDQRARLDTILADIEVVHEVNTLTIDGEELLPEKDRPILRAAVCARATHLITGDLTHFGPFFSRRLHGVLITTPGAYLRSR